MTFIWCLKNKDFNPLLHSTSVFQPSTPTQPSFVLHHNWTSLNLNVSSLHSTTLHYTTIQWIEHQYTSLNCTAFYWHALNWNALNSTALNFTALSCTALNYNTLPCSNIHFNCEERRPTKKTDTWALPKLWWPPPLYHVNHAIWGIFFALVNLDQPNWSMNKNYLCQTPFGLYFAL